MNDLFLNFNANYAACVLFLKNKFRTAPLVNATFHDIAMDAIEKILRNPNLRRDLATWIYVSNFCAIDVLRKQSRELLVSDFPTNTPLSMWDNNDLEKKELLETVICAINELNTRQRALFTLKYHAFTITDSNDTIICAKNQPRLDSKQLAKKLGYPSATALRQDSFRAIIQLRTRLIA